MNMDKDYRTQCKQVWLEAWVRTAQSGCASEKTPTVYADECLSKFMERFPRPILTVDE